VGYVWGCEEVGRIEDISLFCTVLSYVELVSAFAFILALALESALVVDFFIWNIGLRF